MRPVQLALDALKRNKILLISVEQKRCVWGGGQSRT